MSQKLDEQHQLRQVEENGIRAKAVEALGTSAGGFGQPILPSASATGVTLSEDKHQIGAPGIPIAEAFGTSDTSLLPTLEIGVGRSRSAVRPKTSALEPLVPRMNHLQGVTRERKKKKRAAVRVLRSGHFAVSGLSVMSALSPGQVDPLALELGDDGDSKVVYKPIPRQLEPNVELPTKQAGPRTLTSTLTSYAEQADTWPSHLLVNGMRVAGAVSSVIPACAISLVAWIVPCLLTAYFIQRIFSASKDTWRVIRQTIGPARLLADRVSPLVGSFLDKVETIAVTRDSATRASDDAASLLYALVAPAVEPHTGQLPLSLIYTSLGTLLLSLGLSQVCTPMDCFTKLLPVLPEAVQTLIANFTSMSSGDLPPHIKSSTDRISAYCDIVVQQCEAKRVTVQPPELDINTVKAHLTRSSELTPVSRAFISRLVNKSVALDAKARAFSPLGHAPPIFLYFPDRAAMELCMPLSLIHI